VFIAVTAYDLPPPIATRLSPSAVAAKPLPPAAAAAIEPATDDRGSAGEDSVGAAPAVETPEPVAVSPLPATVEHPDVTRETRAGGGKRALRGRFSSMTIEGLQTKYVEVVGRPTGSTHRAYLVWKIREAEKGRIPVGPCKVRQHVGEPVDLKILPLRVESVAVDRMDEAWRTRGIKSRMEFLRRAVGHYLEHIGANEAAALFATGTDGAG
jgi:hypothetical protein